MSIRFKDEEIKQRVRRHYGGRVLSSGSCCGDTSCCAPETTQSSPRAGDAFVEFIGPSLGCGNPLTFAELQPGETVVDLGSGAGREVLQAAVQVGGAGKSIGIDMTPEMVSRARANTAQAGVANAEFRLGEIEHSPLPDNSVDVVVSNCVINLIPDKGRAFQEAYRVLRPGGRLVVADMVSNGPLPENVQQDADAWAGCIAGAIVLQEYLGTIEAAGFQHVKVLQAGAAASGQVYSVTVRAVKPATERSSPNG